MNWWSIFALVASVVVASMVVGSAVGWYIRRRREAGAKWTNRYQKALDAQAEERRQQEERWDEEGGK